MKKSYPTLLCALFVITALAAAVPLNAAADVSISVGDYWNYTYEGDYEGMTIDGNMKLKVADARSSGGVDVLIVEMSGTAELSGGFEGMTVSGEMTVTGQETRLASNFSILASVMMFGMDMEMTGLTLTMKMGMESEYSSPLDDYIGDDSPAVGVTVVSHAQTVSDVWTNFLGMNESDTVTADETSTMEVVQANVSVTVPAGTFECFKVAVETDEDGDIGTMVCYYSEEVGNYVKMEGDDLYGGMFTGLELESYSYGEGGDGDALAMFTGENWWVTVVIIAAVVVLVVAIVMARRRKRVPAMMPPQPQPMYPPPTQPVYPPPPGVPPQTPPPGSGPGPG